MQLVQQHSKMIESHESLKNRIYFAAKDGMHIVLFALLTDNITSEEANDLLNEKYIDEDGQQSTPLIMAARHGHDNVVKVIVSNFKTNLEEEGIVKFDGYVIEGASALWCAAGGGYLNVVKTLVKAGADVNHPTRTQSTPLRAACFDGRLDIVKYLTEHTANIHIANKYNNTCLMIAAYKGHLDVVSFLLERNANPNEKALCGATALHFAAECGHTPIVKKLLEYNAELWNVNDIGMTPLKAAAERTRWEVVDFLVNQAGIGKEEIVEALELLGASYANDKEFYSLERAFKYLHRSMVLRCSESDNVMRKRLIKPVPAYECWVECENLQQLESIRYNVNALHMESLTIRERILGIRNPDLPHPIIFRGAVFADNARFDRCIELWLHAINLRQANNISVVKDLRRFAQVFSQMIHLGVDVIYDHVMQVLSAVITELERNKEKLARKSDMETVFEEMESNITTTLYIITILTKMIQRTPCTAEQEFDISRMVFKLNQMQLKHRDGQTLLHLACNGETPVDDFHISDICKFPCSETASLLIQCGADVNAMDMDRNTPLHIIVNYHKTLADFITLHTIILNLTDAGAHIDCVNNDGKTPLESGKNGVAQIILKTQAKLSLKCMAAMAVKNHQLTYRGQVPEALESFIELHGSNVNN
ncbi:PREDICTED: protein fem-1 homolog B [Nicrophorus vespilloides]|uniref:Protein fem-1 homolog B n=1 Tax=Nicrophorus vespilloides TaxID=110193 RepID=A0ABM1MU67_NICVS|nr:PREDICTED: protein fem-1 homolog B [Nicrophorus vespilloides]